MQREKSLRNVLPLLLLLATVATIGTQIPIVSSQTAPPEFTFPPNNRNSLPLIVFDQVNIYAYYTKEPAPMGIADYGVSPYGAYIINTTQWLGNVIIYSLSTYSRQAYWARYSVSFQLNVVLSYNYNGKSYALWIQDVAIFNTNNKQVYFIDNIWNLTSPYASVSGVSGNGQIALGSYHPRIYFYYYVAQNYPGSPATLTLPSKISLLVNVSKNSLGQPVIYFWYNDGYGWVNYDVVTVTNVINASNVYFVVNGNTYTGSGNFYDAELIVGGPGGGSSSIILSGSVDFRLYYWNGHNFQEVRNAYNFGSNTAETVSNAIVYATSVQVVGLPTSHLIAGSGKLGALWSISNTIKLTVLTTISSGYLYVYNSSFPYSTAITYKGIYQVPFTGYGAMLTLFPANYTIILYNQNNQQVGEVKITTYPSQNVTVTI